MNSSKPSSFIRTAIQSGLVSQPQIESALETLRANGGLDALPAVGVGEERLASLLIDQGVITVATKRGLRPTAITDITSRARSVFKLENGVPRAFEADGETVRYGKDGVSPMTLEEWVDTQVTEAPHLFESNAGSGAAGNGSGGVGGKGPVRNPYRKDTWNLTEQMKLMKSDPQLAQRLKSAALRPRGGAQ